MVLALPAFARSKALRDMSHSIAEVTESHEVMQSYGAKNAFCDSIFYQKRIILTRQARGKHRESTQKDINAFLAGSLQIGSTYQAWSSLDTHHQENVRLKTGKHGSTQKALQRADTKALQRAVHRAYAVSALQHSNTPNPIAE